MFFLSGGEHFPLWDVLIGITYPIGEYSLDRPQNASCYNIEYVEEGEGEVLLNGKWERVHPHETYLLREGEAHHYRSDPQNPWKKLWISFHGDYIGQMLDAYGLPSGIYRAPCADLFARMLAISKGEGEEDALYAIAECLHTVITRLALSERSSGKEDASAIKEALSACVFSRCDLVAIAKGFYMSRSNLIRTFRRAYGITPYQYVLECKTEAAKSLLRNTNLSLAAIAEQLCFPDEHYFSNLFLQKVGMRPAAYRKSTAL